jgi:hypothetical protein
VGAEMPVPQIEPVSVDSGDELAAVAGALNTVQTSVVDLAARQAVYRRNISDLFVSLNGRNQELLRRQLGLLGQLDTPVATPTARASLSQVDHLATQMRRNTESLLAVAGVDARRVWQAPVDIDEVVGYALGEVSDTRRTVVHDLEPAAIAGAAAGDLVHLLAELIETSLEFSAHERRQIEVRGGPKHETGGYWLAVVDFGAVLTPREVQVVNQQLSGNGAPPQPSSSPSNGAVPGVGVPGVPGGGVPAVPAPAPAPVAGPGHTVAGQLAKRAGVIVQLDSSAGWGVTVSVDIPGELIVRRLSDNHDPLAFGPPPVTGAPLLPGTTMAPPPAPTLRDSYR